MIKGSCLCQGVRFELNRIIGPFELCHCSRCRKVSGSAFMAAVGVESADFKMLQGAELVVSYTAPLLQKAPAYQVNFCKICGCSVPHPRPHERWFEIAAGLLDDPIPLNPDKHIYIEHGANWWQIKDELPQYDATTLAALRGLQD